MQLAVTDWKRKVDLVSCSDSWGGLTTHFPPPSFLTYVGGHLPLFLFHNSCLRPLQLCCYCLVAPFDIACSTQNILLVPFFFSFSPVSLIKPSLDQPGGFSSGFVSKQPGGFLGFCLQAAWRVSSGFVQLCCYCLVAPLRPAPAAPSSLEVFLGFCSPAAWRLILGFC